jgi:hypothetical protein
MQVVGKFYDFELSPTMLEAYAAACKGPRGNRLIPVIEHGIVPIDVNQAARYYTVERYVQTGTLRDLMKAGLPLERGFISLVLNEMAAALHALHSSGLLHRNIEPASFLVEFPDSSLRLRLAGIDSMILHAGMEAEPNLIENDYIAPERLKGRYGPPAEWWAVGLIVFEALMGHHAFSVMPGVNRSVILEALTQGRPVNITSTPKPWQRLLSGLLTHLPDRRWGYDQIQLFLNGKDLPQPPPFENPRKPRRLLALRDQSCATPAEVALACARDWPASGRELLGDRRLVEWLNAIDLPVIASQIDRLRFVGHVEDADEHILNLMLILDPTIEPNFSGQMLATEDIAALARRALGEAPAKSGGAPCCKLVDQLFRFDILFRFQKHVGLGERLAGLARRWRTDHARLHGRCARLAALTSRDVGLAQVHQLAYLLLAHTDPAFLSAERTRLDPLVQSLRRMTGAPNIAGEGDPVDLCSVLCFEQALARQRSHAV